jgi:hypothetical protein
MINKLKFKRTKKKLKKIRIIICKSIKKGIEYKGYSIAKTKGIL